MKRKNNLFQQIVSYDNLELAHRHARRGKGHYQEVQMVNDNTEFFLKTLQMDLIEHKYHTSPYEKFTKMDGVKERVIYKLPYYPDRICQWAIIQIIEKELLKHFTDDTYSAIPGKGIHYGVRRIKYQLKHDPENCKYCLKLDIHHYYPFINRDILKEQYRRLFKDKDLLWLLDEIIDSCEEEDTGIPIGNYLSQYSGNLYLSWFDHWIKEELKVKYYHRYMDDVVIFASSTEYLRQVFYKIRDYLMDKLLLQIKPNWQIFPTYVRGVDFLGYRFFGDYTILRKRTAQAVKKKYYKIKRRGYITEHDIKSMQSYLGWTKYCNAYKFTQKYIQPIIDEGVTQ